MGRSPVQQSGGTLRRPRRANNRLAAFDAFRESARDSNKTGPANPTGLLKLLWSPYERYSAVRETSKVSGALLNEGDSLLFAASSAAIVAALAIAIAPRISASLKYG